MDKVKFCTTYKGLLQQAKALYALVADLERQRDGLLKELARLNSQQQKQLTKEQIYFQRWAD